MIMHKYTHLHVHIFTHTPLPKHLFAIFIFNLFVFPFVIVIDWLLQSIYSICTLIPFVVYPFYHSLVFVLNRLSSRLFTQSLRSGVGFNSSWNSSTLLTTHCDFHLSPLYPICSLYTSLPIFSLLFSNHWGEFFRQKLSNWVTSSHLAVFPLSRLSICSLDCPGRCV